MSVALRTRFTELVGSKLPVVQTGMGWVAGGGLTAATCSAGAFGIIASATMSLEELCAAIDQVLNSTRNPFGVNLLPEMPDLCERMTLIQKSGVRLVSFAGPPTENVVNRAHDAGLLVMVTVGAPRHAQKMVEIGVDALIAQGAEGGGHTGKIPTSLLLPAVIEVVNGEVPVLGAGGFHSGRSLVAALAWGADGIAMGTRFLLTSDSRVPEPVKQRYLATNLHQTTVTSTIDGKPQRVISTSFVKALERAHLSRFLRSAFSAWRFRRSTGTSIGVFVRHALALRDNQDLSWRQLALAANAPMMTKTALVDGKLSAGILPTGQVVGLIEELPSVSEFLATLVAEAQDVLDQLGSRTKGNLANGGDACGELGPRGHFGRAM